jgi:Domain of unknown function (DUF4262)
MDDSSFRNKFHNKITEDIKRCGRSIIGVFASGEEDGPPFAYTIGNAVNSNWDRTAALPELLVIGTTNAGWLNNLSQQMIDAEAPFEDGATVLIPGAHLPVKIIRANSTAQTEYAIQAGQYFGTDSYPIMQVLIPDRNGKFPDETGCAAPFSTIPVLRSS